jgi:hypothetical protein
MIDKPPAFLQDINHSDHSQNFTELTDAQVDELNLLFAESYLFIEQLNSSYTFPFGFYRAGFERGNWRQFYKVLPHNFLELENHASHFELALLQKGVCSRGMQVRETVHLNRAYCLCQMDYLVLGSFSGRVGDAYELGKELRKVHQVLKNSEYSPTVKQNWLNKLASFKRCFAQFKALEKWPDLVSKNEVDELEGQISFLEFDLVNAQIVHGDLNHGNVLFFQQSNEKDQPIILDYENSRYAYFPPIFDIGMLVERLLLKHSNQEQLIDTFISGYGHFSISKGNDISLSDAMIAMSVRSRYVLIEKFIHGGKWYPSEWKKFGQLIQMAKHRAHILKKYT